MEGFLECIPPTAAAGTISAGQSKVKADFCAACPDGRDPSFPSSCSQFFAVTAGDAGTLAYGVGYPVLEVNDTLANEMDACLSGVADAGAHGDGSAPLGCALAFNFCASAILQASGLSCQADAGL